MKVQLAKVLQERVGLSEEISLQAAGEDGGDLTPLLSFAEQQKGTELGERALINAFVAARAIGDTAYSRLQRGLEMTRDDYRAALAKRAAARQKVAEIGAGADGFITLASSGPAPFVEHPNVDTDAPDRAGAHMETGSRSFISPWTMIGGPSWALPYFAVDGMPQGVQLMGVPDSDADIVAIAHWLDRFILEDPA